MTLTPEEKKVEYASYGSNSESSVIQSENATKRSASGLSTSQKCFHRKEDQNKGELHVPKLRGIIIMAACLYMPMSGFGMMSALGVVYVELLSAFQCLRSEAALVQSLFMGIMLGKCF